MKRHLTVLALLCAALPRAHAASCQISATDLAFAPYSYAGTSNVVTTATVSIHSCFDDGSGADVSYTISIGAGTSNDYTDRRMAGPGALLHYNVYTDPGLVSIWGDGTGGTATVGGTFTVGPGMTSASHTAYGRIPASQTGLEPGLYADNLTITIDY